MKLFWRIVVSLEFCILLLILVSASLGVGSFTLKGDYAAAINSMPLLGWLLAVPAGVSWWLWLALLFLSLLVLNTVFCSFDVLKVRWGRAGLLPLIAPQLIHAGFLLIVLSHFQSAYGSYMQQIEVAEGMAARLPDGKEFGIAGIAVTHSPQGMPIGYAAELVTNLIKPAERVIIRPNHPWFSGDYGVYVKQAEEYPFKRALLEIHREPGVGAALAGALVFTVGTILLLWFRSKSRDAVDIAAPES